MKVGVTDCRKSKAMAQLGLIDLLRIHPHACAPASHRRADAYERCGHSPI